MKPITKLLIMTNVVLILSLSCATAFGAQDKWTEGYGQGNLEYFIDKGNMRLYIGCPTKEGNSEGESSVSLLENDQEIKAFTIEANGISYEAPFSANSRVGDNNFLSLIDSLRRTDATIIYNGKTIKFPKNNAKKVLPVHGKNLECNLSF